MTEEEKNRLIGEVMSALAETKRLRACLEVKFDRMMADVWHVRMYMAGNEKGRFSDGQFHIEGHGTCRLPSNEDVAGLMERIEETKNRIEKLEKQRVEMGV